MGFVAARLPSYMVPVVVVVDRLPLTAVGKVDRAGLPVPDFGAVAGSGRAPVGAVEVVLAGVFAQVLGVESVGAEESFFGLGGDSIMSIQVVARARAAGVVISPREVFERKTVAGLAQVAVVSGVAAGLAELPGGGVGEVAVTPIVAWLFAHGGGFAQVFRRGGFAQGGGFEHGGGFERGAGLARFSQSVVLGLPVGVDGDGLARVVQAVLDRHDMLRARLVGDPRRGGGWWCRRWGRWRRPS